MHQLICSFPVFCRFGYIFFINSCWKVEQQQQTSNEAHGEHNTKKVIVKK